MPKAHITNPLSGIGRNESLDLKELKPWCQQHLVQELQLITNNSKVTENSNIAKYSFRISKLMKICLFEITRPLECYSDCQF
jgi:hypothetical protein